MDVLILILKIAGFAIGLFSTIWAMTKRVSTDQPDGSKKLTREGRFAAALAVCAFLVAGGSVLADRTLTQQHKAEADQAAIRKAEQDRLREQRLLQPIGEFYAQVTWELPADIPVVASATARLADLARRVRADRSLASRLPGISLGEDDLAISPASEFYPRAEHEPVLAGATAWPRAYIAFFAAGASARRGLDALARAQPRSVSPLGEMGDIRFRLTAPERPPLFYNIRTNSLWFEAKLSSRAIVDRSPALLSIPELEAGMVAIDWADNARPAAGLAGQIRALRAAMRVTRFHLRVGGRTYEIQPPRLGRMDSPTGFPVFVANPLGSPRA